MQIGEDFELLECLFVELEHRDRCALLEVAPATGNRLLRSSSEDRGLVSAILDGELGGLLGGESLHKGRS